MRLLKEAYYEASADSIRQFFHKVGILGDEPPRDVISRLVNDGAANAKKGFEAVHGRQLEQFLWHLRQRGKEIKDRPERLGVYWDFLRNFKNES